MVRGSNGEELAKRPAKKPVVAFTGVNGFLGRNLVGILEEDDRYDRLVLLDLVAPATAGAKSRFYRVDLTQPGVDARIAEILSAEGVETLVHLALVSSPTYASAWRHEIESVGTMHVIHACEAAKLRKFVSWSQTLLFGASTSNPNFLTEDRPLRASDKSAFLRDKIEIDENVQAFGERQEKTLVTLLRTCPMLGPTVKNFVTRYFSRRIVPTVLGFDPLVQFVHEVDAVRAFKAAIDRDYPGVFHVVGEGVLPLGTAIKIAGRATLPLPYFTLEAIARVSWAAQFGEAPFPFVDYVRYLCIADGAKAAAVMGFRPVYSTREALIEFAGAQMLREARLLREAE
jgi:UDP-glucose 4-epimerase